MERLQKVIAQAGICSRRKAEELIQAGKVKVNGVIVKTLGVKVSGGDEVVVNGRPLTKEEKVYYVINKPKGTICSVRDEKTGKPCLTICQKASGFIRLDGWTTTRAACCLSRTTENSRTA